jgi:glucose/mannose-6-phosphate isomerase
MTNILDNLPKIAELDKSNLGSSVSELHLQIKQTWSDLSKLKLDKKYKNVKNIVINGMGGSAIGGHIIKSLYKNEMKIPFDVTSSYSLPENINKDSLVILSSYSGNTEEPLFSAKLALERKAKILGIASGGKLEKLCQKNNIPYFLINPKHNSCGQPRMGLGYSIIGQLGLLSKCGIIKISKQQIDTIVKLLEKLNKKWNVEILTKNNKAKKIAIDLYGKIIILVGSEFLSGNAHTFSNQLNEGSKTFANYFILPEVNHHLMEGLSHPKMNPEILKFLFLNSNLYHPRNQQRYQIMKKVVTKNKIPFIEYSSLSKTKLEQSFEVLLLGCYVNFYLAMLNNIDPTLIPWVDYFKKELK